jgi:hypothetical protein
MKTKILIACLASGLLALGQAARAAANPATARSHAVSFESRHHPRQTHRPAPLSAQNISGVIPRAIRGGNPLQMLNPLAPAKYGTAEESVSLDPDVPGKWNGIKLFSISF